MICVCMPSYRLLFVRLFSKGDDSTPKYNPNQNSNYSGSYVKGSGKATPNPTLTGFSQITSESDKPSQSRDADSTHTYGVNFDHLDNYDHDVDSGDQTILVNMKQFDSPSKTRVLS
jgi:hypothetical protein